MVSVPIGGIRVDLQLNSAAFIRDIAKSSAATSKATTAMGKSLTGLRSNFLAVSKMAAGFIAGNFGLTAISRLQALTKESLELARTMGGELGEQAAAAQRSVDNLKNAFQFGFAQGLVQDLNRELLTSQERLDNLTLAGKRSGQMWASTQNLAARGFNRLIELAKELHEYLLKNSDPELNRILQPDNPMFMPTGEGGGASEFAKGVRDSTGEIIAFNAAQAELIAQMKDEPGFWDATTVATRNWTEALRDANSIIEQTQTPLEAYRQKIEEIQLLQNAGILTNQQAATASMQASASMANTWVAAGAAVTGALADLFEGNKAFAIANAVVNTAEAITAALKNPPGPPFSFVYAAAAAASGAAQIAAIVSAKPGTTKAPKSAALKGKGGASSSTAAAGNAARQSGGFTQAVNIEIVGDVFGPEHFRKIVAGLNDVQRDGTALLRMA